MEFIFIDVSTGGRSLTVIEYIPESFYEIVRDADTFDLLCAWKSLYETIDAIARKGWVHRDLSLANVRIRRTQDINGPPSTILIDFDLAARIEGDPSGSPDKTGTLLFMPVHILEHDPGASPVRPVRHQELHEDEAAFWVRFLGLVYRSETGRRYINNDLDITILRLGDLAGRKSRMLMRDNVREQWPSWFIPTKESYTQRTSPSQLSDMLVNYVPLRLRSCSKIHT